MTTPRPGPGRRRAKSAPAGRAVGWWIAGFEERIYPERETVQERVRWGTEARAASGDGADLVVRFPDGADAGAAVDDTAAGATVDRTAGGPEGTSGGDVAVGDRRAAPDEEAQTSMTGSLRIGSIVIRVDDLEREAAFWEAALDCERRPGDGDDFILLRPRHGSGPNLSLDRVRSELRIPPRIHLDLYARDQAAEVARLLALGASEVHWDRRPADADYVILADPEGNRFCVIDAGDA